MLKNYLILILIINITRMFLANYFMINLSIIIYFYAFKTFLSSIKEFINYAVILNVIL